MSANMNPKEMIALLRCSFEHHRTLSVEYRIQQIKNLRMMIVENEEKFVQALKADLHKSRHESIVMEIQFLINDLDNVLAEINDWVKPEKPKKPLVNILDKLYIFNDPYGVVLIIGAWNYPFQLLLMPFAGAIAAGNCVILKPSEVATSSCNLLTALIPKYLDEECYRVYAGGVPETTLLLKEKFDYIFYTGSSIVGKIINEAASKHLTPVTLELGGKSPVYIDNTADMHIAVKRILWGKFANAGQTCVAPDYLLCTKAVEQKFVEISKVILKEFYGSNPRISPDFGRIINDNHFQRIEKLLNNGTVAIGGETDASERYIAPTILTNISSSDPVMMEEIFGPILPIITIDTLYDAIYFINKGDKPLAMYIFSNNKKDVDLLIKHTTCGGLTVNDTVMHLTVDTLPFGGIGKSGIGSYHGKYTFDTFTHKKSCLYKSFALIGEKLGESRYPPYTESKTRLLNFMLKRRGYVSFGFVRYLIAFCFGVATTYLYQNHMAKSN